MKMTRTVYIKSSISVAATAVSICVRPFVFANGKADKTFNMFKLIVLLVVAMMAVSAEPAPVPPVISHPLVYSQPYVKVLPLHSATYPLSYSHGYGYGYKLLHPSYYY
ncbi:uncharacterized protein LOC143219287 [Lasioglossum baleicum]|uniref:uncharacterized protein LOC143219287 n=1 Tax=Lasioglossum baleicum TaxID=434251 RepID=UPI003FCC6BA0